MDCQKQFIPALVFLMILGAYMENNKKIFKKIQKRVSDSYSEQVQVITQSNLNGYNRLFGGQIMSWIDIVAAVAARRHSNSNVTTASVSGLTFSAPAYANETVILCGHIVYVGRTSMDVCVETFVENLDGTRRVINTAYLR